MVVKAFFERADQDLLLDMAHFPIFKDFVGLMGKKKTSEVGRGGALIELALGVQARGQAVGGRNEWPGDRRCCRYRGPRQALICMPCFLCKLFMMCMSFMTVKCRLRPRSPGNPDRIPCTCLSSPSLSPSSPRSPRLNRALPRPFCGYRFLIRVSRSLTAGGSGCWTYCGARGATTATATTGGAITGAMGTVALCCWADPTHPTAQSE